MPLSDWERQSTVSHQKTYLCTKIYHKAKIWSIQLRLGRKLDRISRIHLSPVLDNPVINLDTIINNLTSLWILRVSIIVQISTIADSNQSLRISSLAQSDPTSFFDNSDVTTSSPSLKTDEDDRSDPAALHLLRKPVPLISYISDGGMVSICIGSTRAYLGARMPYSAVSQTNCSLMCSVQRDNPCSCG